MGLWDWSIYVLEIVSDQVIQHCLHVDAVTPLLNLSVTADSLHYSDGTVRRSKMADIN